MQPTQSKDFFHDYMWHPLAPELTGWQKAGYLLSTMALGILSVGIVHIVVALTLKDREVKAEEDGGAVHELSQEVFNQDKPLPEPQPPSQPWELFPEDRTPFPFPDVEAEALKARKSELESILAETRERLDKEKGRFEYGKPGNAYVIEQCTRYQQQIVACQKDIQAIDGALARGPTWWLKRESEQGR